MTKYLALAVLGVFGGLAWADGPAPVHPGGSVQTTVRVEIKGTLSFLLLEEKVRPLDATTQYPLPLAVAAMPATVVPMAAPVTLWSPSTALPRSWTSAATSSRSGLRTSRCSWPRSSISPWT